jgi:hypothetical protein
VPAQKLGYHAKQARVGDELRARENKSVSEQRLACMNLNAVQTSWFDGRREPHMGFTDYPRRCASLADVKLLVKKFLCFLNFLLCLGDEIFHLVLVEIVEFRINVLWWLYRSSECQHGRVCFSGEKRQRQLCF